MRRLGAHRYLSTACHHAQHERCRLTCKFCPVPCRCRCHAGAKAPQLIADPKFEAGTETWVEKRLRTDERFTP